MSISRPPHITRRNIVRDVIVIVVGSFVFAVGFDCFEAPYGLAAGGISGLAVVVARVLADAGITVSVGVLVLLMDALLVAIAAREGGFRYAARSLVGIVASSVFIDLLEPRLPVLGEGDLILCALWGGFVCGFGLGLVFRVGGNTGGTDIIAQIAARYTALSMGTASLMADIVVVLLSIPVFGMETALYASVAMYVGARVLDMVVDGFNTQRAAYVISDRHALIKQHIFDDLDRGCTELLARGGYTGKDRPVLFVILTRSEMALLRSIVAEVDPEATVVVGMLHEAYGNGFHEIRQQL